MSLLIVMRALAFSSFLLSVPIKAQELAQEAQGSGEDTEADIGFLLVDWEGGGFRCDFVLPCGDLAVPHEQLYQVIGR